MCIASRIREEGEVHCVCRSMSSLSLTHSPAGGRESKICCREGQLVNSLPPPPHTHTHIATHIYTPFTHHNYTTHFHIPTHPPTQAEQIKQAAIISSSGDSQAAQLLSNAFQDAGDGLVELRRLEAAEEIAGTLSRSRNVAYLPGGGQNLLLSIPP